MAKSTAISGKAMARATQPAKHPGSDASLSIGFLACIALTFTAYCIVTTEGLNPTAKVLIIAGLAFIQFVTQMVLFLHLGRERKPRWKLWMFFAMAGVVLIVIIGSLWIMHNLDYNMMHFNENQQNDYLRSNEGL